MKFGPHCKVRQGERWLDARLVTDNNGLVRAIRVSRDHAREIRSMFPGRRKKAGIYLEVYVDGFATVHQDNVRDARGKGPLELDEAAMTFGAPRPQDGPETTPPEETRLARTWRGREVALHVFEDGGARLEDGRTFDNPDAALEALLGYHVNHRAFYGLKNDHLEGR